MRALSIREQMKKLVLICCAVASLAIAAPALAQYGGGGADNQVENPDPCQGTMNIDTCMWSDSNTTAGGSYTTCTASGSAGQGCQSVVRDVLIDKTSCATVYYSASCNCDPKTYSTTGKCTYTN